MKQQTHTTHRNRTSNSFFLILSLGLFGCYTERKIPPEETPSNLVLDADGDGYSEAEDCNDEDPYTHNGATEVCDGVDNDCDGEVDEGVLLNFYEDTDGDGFGNPDTEQEACEATEETVSNGNDCDDNSDETHPGATEICDGVDNDCDDDIDEEVGTTYYQDLDEDGFGAGEAQSLCEETDGWVEQTGDCDDSETSSYPGATEVCDGIDNDCDDDIDEEVALIQYPDNDSDGYGGSNNSIEECTLLEGYSEENTDCNDYDSDISPDAEEICDEVDNNCDGFVDEATAIDTETWYLDSDEDGFGDATQSQNACSQPTGSILLDGDCDDTNMNINPDAEEICDGIDNNCDGVSDGGIAGIDPTCSALSCLDVLNQNPTSTDGTYWIDPMGTGAYEAYCDMTQNGGGWTLLLKTDGLINTHFYYSDPKWSNSTLHNETSVDISNATAKLEPFVSLEVEELYGCFPTQNGHCIYADTNASQTAQQLFSGSMLQIGNGFNNQMYSGWSYQYNCNFFGFNSTHGGLKVRFGFVANQENNCNTNDTTIGFGLGYTNTSNNITNYNSGQICAYAGCSLYNYHYEGFPGLLWGR